MKYAVIDVGSNTVRLCVYDVLCPEKRKFKTIMNRKIMAGLAAYIVDGAFSDEGIAEAILAVKKCIKRASYLSPDRIDMFATAVLRNISNSAQAIAAIEQGAGCTISLLSNADEAHLGFVGASSRGTLDDGALIDIGGGSTEITVIENGIDVARNFFARSARHNPCVHFRKRANGATDTVEFLGRASTGARFVGGNKPATARANGRNLVLGGQNVAHETLV